MAELRNLVIVGYPQDYHIGAHLRNAAAQLGLSVSLIDPTQAFQAPWVLRQINWHLRERRPTYLENFNQHVVEQCRELEPDYLLVTGLLPVTESTIRNTRSQGTICANYLTDDLWNPVHYSRRHIAALSAYDIVFSPRKANLDDLKAIGCSASYMPFAYEPSIHFPSNAQDTIPDGDFDCDIMFYGGADRDRVPIMKSILDAGFALRLYGGYWDKLRTTRVASRGHVMGAELRQAVAGARVCLCLVRRANRDGHVMRTFEVPAMGGCMLTEDTTEHRDLLGPEGENVLYFKSTTELIDKTKRLLGDNELRRKLSQNAYNHVVLNRNTYYDRLVQMFDRIRSANRGES